MKNHFRRRELLVSSSQCISYAVIPWSLLSCGTSSNHRSLKSRATDERDIIIRQVGHLPYEYVNSPQDVTLHFRELGHKHAIALSKQDLMALGQGNVVEKESEETWGHSHFVRIDPMNRSESSFHFAEFFITPKGEDPIPTELRVTKQQLQNFENLSFQLKWQDREYRVLVEESDICALRANMVVRQLKGHSLQFEEIDLILVPQAKDRFL